MCVENGVVVEVLIAPYLMLSPKELLRLGFGKCNLCVQVPIASGITSVDELIGKRVVTSFENVVHSYFSSREAGSSHESACAFKNVKHHHDELKTAINYVNGSVEAACALGLADGLLFHTF